METQSVNETPEQQEVREAALKAISQVEEFEQEVQDIPEEMPEKAKEEKLELVECPRCGHKLKDRESLKPEESEIREYFRCLTGKRTFKKAYSLFGGELTAQYSLLTGDESEILSEALKTVDEDDFITHASKAVRIKVLFYLRRWGDEEFTAPETADKEELAALWKERYGSMGEDVPVLMIKVMLEFIRLTEMLPMAGLDETFYKGVGLS